MFPLNRNSEGRDRYEVDIDVPDEIANVLQEKWPDMTRGVMESIALEGYRCGALGEELVRRLLGFPTRFEVHAFLKEHDVPLNYGMKALEHDREVAKRLGIV